MDGWLGLLGRLKRLQWIFPDSGISTELCKLLFVRMAPASPTFSANNIPSDTSRAPWDVFHPLIIGIVSGINGSRILYQIQNEYLSVNAVLLKIERL